jgi:hypothetical protein
MLESFFAEEERKSGEAARKQLIESQSAEQRMRQQWQDANQALVRGILLTRKLNCGFELIGFLCLLRAARGDCPSRGREQTSSSCAT